MFTVTKSSKTVELVNLLAVLEIVLYGVQLEISCNFEYVTVFLIAVRTT
jgi:hypothetical protein